MARLGPERALKYLIKFLFFGMILEPIEGFQLEQVAYFQKSFF